MRVLPRFGLILLAGPLAAGCGGTMPGEDQVEDWPEALNASRAEPDLVFDTIDTWAHSGQTNAFEELSHEVRVQLGDGQGTYRVQRHFRNNTDMSLALNVPVVLPKGGAMLGLTVGYRGRTLNAQLMGAEKARETYDLYSGLSGPREELLDTSALLLPPTLVSWSYLGELSMDAHPIGPGETISIEYTLVQPSCYRDGLITLGYPLEARETRAAVPSFRFEDSEHGHTPSIRLIYEPTHTDEAQEDVCGRTDPTARIDFDAVPVKEVAGRFASLQLQNSERIFSIDLDVAQELAPKPVAASVVFLLDASFSFNDLQLSAQLEVVDAYLSHVPDARFELVRFDRRAQRMLGYFAAAAGRGAISSIPEEMRKLANGSHLDEALAVALELLKNSSGPQRIVLLTDGRARQALSIDQLADLLEGASNELVLHLVDIGGASAETNLERNDEHRLADLPLLTEGVAFSLSISKDEPLAPSLLPLVRPTSIDHVELIGAPTEFDGETSLQEGSSFRRLSTTEFPVDPEIQLRGYIWGRPWHRTIRPPEDAEPRLAARVLGDGLVENLDDRDVEMLGRLCGGVSEMTSYLAVDGAAPALDHLGGIGLHSIGTGSSCGCGGVIGLGRRGFSYAQLRDPQVVLGELLAPILETCESNFPELLSVETTDDEIVDIQIKGLDETESHCVEEALWSTRLPSNVPWREQTHVLTDREL